MGKVKSIILAGLVLMETSACARDTVGAPSDAEQKEAGEPDTGTIGIKGSDTGKPDTPESRTDIPAIRGPGPTATDTPASSMDKPTPQTGSNEPRAAPSDIPTAAPSVPANPSPIPEDTPDPLVGTLQPPKPLAAATEVVIPRSFSAIARDEVHLHWSKRQAADCKNTIRLARGAARTTLQDLLVRCEDLYQVTATVIATLGGFDGLISNPCAVHGHNAAVAEVLTDILTSCQESTSPAHRVDYVRCFEVTAASLDPVVYAFVKIADGNHVLTYRDKTRPKPDQVQSSYSKSPLLSPGCLLGTLDALNDLRPRFNPVQD